MLHLQNSTEAKPLFLGDRVERPLVLVVDVDSVPWDPDGTDMEGLLAGLCTEKEVVVFLFSDEGPSSSVDTMKTDFWPPAAIGWLVATAGDDEVLSHTLVVSDGDSIRHAALFRDPVHWIGQQVGKAEAVLVLAASEIGADLVVTNRPTLLSKRPIRTPQPLTVASPAEALSLVGLFLRSTGRYLPTRSSKFTLTYNRGFYWQEAVRLFVPEIRKVVGLSVELGLTRTDDSLGALAFASHRRLARSFERRDAAWRLINQAQDLDIADDLRTAVESILTYLMGAFDATARLVDRALGIDTANTSWIGWQKPKWRQSVRRLNRNMAAVFDAESRGLAVVEILGLLRNLIHSEGLDSVTFRHADRTKSTSTLLVLSQENQAALLDHMRKVEGTLWGRRGDVNGRATFDFGDLVDGLLIEVLAVMKDIMSHLEEELLGLGLTLPPPPKSDFNEELVDEHLRWGIALGSPSA